MPTMTPDDRALCLSGGKVVVVFLSSSAGSTVHNEVHEFSNESMEFSEIVVSSGPNVRITL